MIHSAGVGEFLETLPLTPAPVSSLEANRMEGTDPLKEEWVLEGDAEWRDGARLTPYHIRCEDGSEYWRVVHEIAGESLWSRTNPNRQTAFQLVYDEMKLRAALKAASEKNS